jgi:CheY-like chemotaxis protein
MDRILYIEDNEQNFYLVNFILTSYGYSIVHASSGPEGIGHASKESFNLVLLDIQLPGMDGYAVARQLRKLPAYETVNIVAITSYAMPGDREKAFEAGCTGYIEKPINPDTFIYQIREYVGNK